MRHADPDTYANRDTDADAYPHASPDSNSKSGAYTDPHAGHDTDANANAARQLLHRTGVHRLDWNERRQRGTERMDRDGA